MMIGRQAKYLEPPMTESETIRVLKRHFDKDVAREIRPSTVRNLKDLVAILDDLDDEKVLRAEKKQPNKLREDETKTVNIGYDYQTRKAGDEETFKVRTSRPYNSGNYARGNYSNNPPRRYEEEYRPQRRIDEPPKVESESQARRNGNEDKRMFIKPEERNWKPTIKAQKGNTNIPNPRKEMAIIRKRDDGGTTRMEGEMEGEIREYEQQRTKILRTQELIEEIDNDFEKEGRIVTKNADPSINVFIGEMEFEALIDTGAQISAITKETVDKLTEAGIEIKSIPIRKLQIRGAFREKGTVVNYKLQLAIQISEA